VFVGVRMTAVDHDGLRYSGLRKHFFGAADVVGRVVRGIVPSAQDDMYVLVTQRVHDRRLAFVVDSQKRMRMVSRLHSVDGDLQIAVSTVLESDREGKSADHLAMRLRFRRARSDGPPCDEI